MITHKLAAACYTAAFATVALTPIEAKAQTAGDILGGIAGGVVSAVVGAPVVIGGHGREEGGRSAQHGSPKQAGMQRAAGAAHAPQAPAGGAHRVPGKK